MKNLFINRYWSQNAAIKKLITAFSILTISFGIVGSQLAMAATCENPDALTFAIIPTEETVAELQLYKPVTDRMEELTGKKIQFFMPTSYASVVEGLLSKFVDVAVLGPHTPMSSLTRKTRVLKSLQLMPSVLVICRKKVRGIVVF